MTAAETKQLTYSVLTDAQKKRFEETLELDFSFGIKGLARFRCNMFNQRGAVAAVYRLIPEKIRNFQELDLPPVLATLAERPRGLVLVTGPTGIRQVDDAGGDDRQDQQGAARSHPHHRGSDRVRAPAPGLPRQPARGAQRHAELLATRCAPRCARIPTSSSSARCATSRPWKSALRIAETGHLTFGTLHTNSAAQTINRIIDIFPAHQQSQIRTQLSLVLEGIVCQALLPKIGGGRVVSLEIMIPTPAIRNLIREDKVHQIYSSMQTGQEKFGMQTMNQSLATLYMKKLITLDSAMTASSNREELQEMINRGVGVVAGAGLGRPGAPRPVGAGSGSRLRVRVQVAGSWRLPALTASSDRLMATFAYSGRTRAGQTVTGERIADTMDAAVAALRREQMLVTQINPVKEKARQGRRAKKRRGPRSVAAKNLAVFTRQFSVMIDAGLPLVQCLEILGTQEEDKNFAAVILATRARRRGGASLADAMKKHPKVFDPLFTNMIAAGEAGGILDTILKRLATYIEKTVKLKGQVKSAMVYPVAVIVIAAVVVGVILWKVIPTFANLFAGLGAELPLPTRVVIALSNGLVRFMPFIIVGIVAAVFGFRAYYATPGRPQDRRRDHAEAADPRHPDAQDRRGALLPHAVHAARVRRVDSRGARHHRPHVGQRHRRGGDPDDAQEHRARRDDRAAAARRRRCSRRWSCR